MERTPIQDSLKAVTQLEPGKYRYEFPRLLCIGMVTSGGLLASASHTVAQLFIADNLKSASHPHLLQSTVYFYRPVFASPKQADISIRLTNLSKIWSTLHIEIAQDGKVCMSGYLTFTNLRLPGQISAATGWTQSTLPPVPPAAITSPQAEDYDHDWISYLTPVASNSIRNAQAYLKYHIPIRPANTSFLDHWVTPGWEDTTRAQGAVWTNELLHFVIDSHLPFWQNYVDSSVVSYGRYEAIVAAGLEQRQARKEGRDDRIFGKDCGPTGPLGWVSSSVSMSTEFKKLLPDEGSKWLFMRCVTSKLHNNRLDERVFLTDVEGDLVAIAHQLVHVIPMASKMADKRAKM